MSRLGRIAIVLGLFVAAVALAVTGAYGYMGSEPATVNYVAGHASGQPVDLVFQTDGVGGTGIHPTWVSYQTRTPRSHQWVHTTLVELPAHTTINVTIYQFDSGSPLRNQHWGQVTGTTGTKATLTTTTTFKVINSNKRTVGHTFTVPELGINVPLLGVPDSKEFCTKGPCNPTKQAHHKITFSFKTPGPGNYHFQCFIPCGAGFYGGNGGPMQTVGYMGGFLEVMA